MRRISHRARSRSRPGNQLVPLRRGNAIARLKQSHNLQCWNARGDLTNRCVTHYAAGIDDEHRRLGDPALFFRVINAPRAHDRALRVAQDRKREVQRFADALRFFRAVNRHSRQRRSCGSYVDLVNAIIRQLAEAKRSPVPAVENQHQRIRGAEAGEQLRSAGGIGQLEIGRDLAHLQRLLADGMG